MFSKLLPDFVSELEEALREAGEVELATHVRSARVVETRHNRGAKSCQVGENCDPRR